MKISEANRLRILYFLVFCCTAAWLPIIASFLTNNGLSGWRHSLVMIITPVMMFLIQPYYGTIIDKYGYKKCLLLATFFASITYVGYLADQSFWWLVVVTMLMSLFYNSIQPILDSLSLQLAQNNPKFSYGKLRIAGAAGWAVTGIITGYLIDFSDTTIIFLVSAISMFLTFLFALPLKTQGRHEGATDQSFHLVGKLLRIKTLFLLLLCVVLISAGTQAIWYFYSPYMAQIGASAAVTGYGLSLQGLCELPLFYFSAQIIRRFGMKTTLLITIFVTVVRMLLYTTVKNPYTALPIELLHGISWSLFWAVCVEFVNSLVPEEKRATGQSLLYAAYYGVGTIAGISWVNYLAETEMKMSQVFLLNAGIVFVTGILALFFLKRKQEKTILLQ
jgi:MFS transporter, PPP family, 3-phenylpropionic acid transporter